MITDAMLRLIRGRALNKSMGKRAADEA